MNALVNVDASILLMIMFVQIVNQDFVSIIDEKNIDCKTKEDKHLIKNDHFKSLRLHEAEMHILC